MSETTTIMFNVSEKFEEAINQFIAGKNPQPSRAGLIREALAAYIKYDLSAEPKSARKTKYSTVEERKQAAKDRAKKRRQLTAQLLKAYEQEDNEEAIKALLASLKETEEETTEE